MAGPGNFTPDLYLLRGGMLKFSNGRLMRDEEKGREIKIKIR